MSAKVRFNQIVYVSMAAEYGITAFTLPRLVAVNIGTNGWAAIPLFGSIAAINIGLFALVYHYAKGADIVTIARRVLPSFITIPLFCLLAVQWGVLGALVGKEYLLILRSLSFPTLAPFYLYLLFGYLVFLLLSKGIFGISNSAVLFFFFSIWMLPLIPYSLSTGFQFSRLTTFWFENSQHSFKGMVEIYYAFLGYEVMLLLMPFSDKHTRLIRAFQIGNGICTILYSFMSFLAIGFFSFGQLKQLSYPLLNMLSNIRSPFAQRLDDIIFNLTLLRALFITTIFIWMAFDTISKMRPNTKKQKLPYVVMMIIYVLVMFLLPSNLERTRKFLSQIGAIEIGVAFCLPLLLLLLVFIHKVKERRKYA
ncbi:GerAB/ArcD/ProY family transporter [Paenibacillus sp. OV219]|uniref:GerAB/ArcD/ProY family transporter n=1 Tax=Paenibacillus sp. OV219 TaxID=1884377 RepID=UPI0008D14508|nr:GerAB/ArcD/ProY family transporter [Paenibacillus sp. OV219]SEM64075.1 Spore germination protein [Paenibacillus sp. OV219]